MTAAIDTRNEQAVGAHASGRIAVLKPAARMTHADALRFAAWLRALADPDRELYREPPTPARAPEGYRYAWENREFLCSRQRGYDLPIDEAVLFSIWLVTIAEGSHAHDAFEPIFQAVLNA